MVIPEEVRQQLKDRFEAALSGPVHLTLYTKPGSSRLILPAGVGCPTCGDAREMAELLRDSAPEKITLEQVDVGDDPDRTSIDAVERVSRAEHGLRDESLAALARLTEPAEVMVFATPT